MDSGDGQRFPFDVLFAADAEAGFEVRTRADKGVGGRSDPMEGRQNPDPMEDGGPTFPFRASQDTDELIRDLRRRMAEGETRDERLDARIVGLTIDMNAALKALDELLELGLQVGAMPEGGR